MSSIFNINNNNTIRAFDCDSDSDSDCDSDYESVCEKHDVMQDHFEDNSRVAINGDGVKDLTWFVKIKPSGISHIDYWELNRSINDDFVSKIVDEQEKHYRKFGRYNFIDPIHLCRLETEDNISYQLLDGQHRLNAYGNLEFKQDRPRLPAIIIITIVSISVIV